MPQSAPARERASVAVVGLGNIGASVAGSLAHAGRHDVVACVRRPLERLTVDRPEGTVEVALAACTDPGAAAPVDWVLLATKAHHTASAAPWLARLCSPSTRVAVLQNGIDHATRVAPFIGQATAVPIMVYFNGERLAPDRVRMRHIGAEDFEAPDDVEGRAFAQLLEGTAMSVRLIADFKTQAWRKLLINSVANPMTSLTLRRQEVLRRPDIHTLCLAVLDEAVAVARADGARLTVDDEPAQIMARLRSFGPELGTSMYFDRLAGRPLEVEALTGAIVAAGQRLDIPTPLNTAMLALLRAVSDGANH
jgi:2-dehydropantoate 2-reductase